MKTYTLNEIKNDVFIKIETTKRDKYEYNLKMDIMGDLVKQAREKRNLTQEL